MGGRRLKLMSTSADSDAQHPSSACTLLSLVRTGLCITGRWQGGGRAAAGAALMSRVGFLQNFLNIFYACSHCVNQSCDIVWSAR